MDTFTTPLLSVVVPFYNVEAYIGDCLESIRTQLLDDIEVVMVDDGSKDGSIEVAQRYVDMDPRFRLVRQENQGLGPARNTGTAHAQGKYLTFVDSDDLVAPRAYTLMVDSLEETGSSFAAGNAYRFSSTKGVYQSWTHRQPFGKTKIATTIDETPVLMRDRMIWNKVYRRSFWDAGGYEFPAIRYEDYMVTLRAYLEAPSVDVFSDHVYFWRDRESGDSITQQAARADNALDRFLSAMMVLDVLDDHDASKEVRERVHAYFIHIDLVALSESMVSVPAEDRPDLEKMALELAHRLQPGIGYETTRLARLVHESLLAGDLPMVANLATWRLSGDTKTFGKKLARHPRPQVIPTALAAVVSRRKPQSPLKARKLKTSATSATWDEQVLTVTASTTLRPQLAHRADVTAQLKWGTDIVADVPVAVTKTPKGLDLAFTIDSRVLRQLGDEWKMAILWVELRLTGLLWRGQVRFSTDACPGIRQISDGTWVQPRGIGWWFGLQRLTHPTVIERIELDGGVARVIPAVGNLERPLEVRRPAPSPLIEFRLADGDAEIPVAALLDGDPADNLVTGVAERTVVQVLERRMEPLWRFNEVNENKTDLSEFKRYYDEYTYLAGDPVTTVVDDRRLTIGRGWYGMLVVRQEPVGDHVEGLTPMEEAEGTGEDAERAEAL
ncbi:glycosyltransferase family 2 protein [Dermacoccus nishinomiyaensis]|uniref:glycosyltransferase family 2 protein n=1 Tax=Dermacoccus nishinomiyaensis TaxID=1274 RepID=UPI0033A983B8